MSWPLMHDLAHCHCRRCESLNRNLGVLFAIRLIGVAILVAGMTFLLYDLVRWVMDDLPGLTRIPL